MDQVEEIKRKTDIVALVSEYVELKKAGRNYKGLCPFHNEKTPSFIVTPELQIFKCFGCGTGGDVYSFLIDVEKLDFPQALKILADRAGVKLVAQKGFAPYAEKDELFSLNYLTREFYHYLLTKHKVGEIAREYLKQRGIKNESVETFRLGFSPQKPDAVFNFLTKKRGYSPRLLEKAGIAVLSRGSYYDRLRGRLIFPLSDHFGNVLGFAGRVIEARGDIAKYINSPETLVYKKGKILYGLDVAKQEIKTQRFVVVVEGEIDCISCWQAGIKNTVAIKGSALTLDQASLLKRFTETIILALDADFAGNEAAKRGLEIAQAQGLTVKIATLGSFKDPDEMARKDPEGLKDALSRAESVYDFLINLVFTRIDTSTTEGKAKASRDLVPILIKIEDDIIRAYCIRLVASKLGVPEEAVISQLRKTNRSALESFAKNKQEPETQKRGRREILDERLLAILFQDIKKLKLHESLLDLIETPLSKRLFLEVISIIKTDLSISLSELTGKLSSELRDLFSTLVLSLTEFEETIDMDQEISKVVGEIEILNLREKMVDLSSQIKNIESIGVDKDTTDLEREMARLSEKLSNLEASVI